MIAARESPDGNDSVLWTTEKRKNLLLASIRRILAALFLIDPYVV